MEFIIFGVILLLLVVALSKDKKLHKISNQPCKKGHRWVELPVEGDEDYVYLKCQDCNKTLSEILN